MERRPARHYEHLVHLAEQVGVHVQLVQGEEAVRSHPTHEGVPNGRGLLVDLLQHEVVEAALLRPGNVPLDLERLREELGAVEVGERPSVGRDLHDLALLDGDHRCRPRQDRRDVRGKQGLTVTEAHDQR